MSIPEFLPVLSKGRHKDFCDGACVMEYVSMLTGEPFTDSPSCTHPVLASAARSVNDMLPDEDRHLLVPSIGRLFGTADTRESDLDRRILGVRLAVWSAHRVEHLLDRCSEPHRRAGRYAIEAAEAWANEPTDHHADEAAHAAIEAASAASAASYAAGAASAASAASYAVGAAACAADAASYAARAAAYGAGAADTRSLTLVGFLSDLLDYHAELTGHQGNEVSDIVLRALAGQVGRR